MRSTLLTIACLVALLVACGGSWLDACALDRFSQSGRLALQRQFPLFSERTWIRVFTVNAFLCAAVLFTFPAAHSHRVRWLPAWINPFAVWMVLSAHIIYLSINFIAQALKMLLMDSQCHMTPNSVSGTYLVLEKFHSQFLFTFCVWGISCRSHHFDDHAARIVGVGAACIVSFALSSRVASTKSEMDDSLAHRSQNCSLPFCCIFAAAGFTIVDGVPLFIPNICFRVSLGASGSFNSIYVYLSELFLQSFIFEYFRCCWARLWLVLH
jgi:hypothetical protein